MIRALVLAAILTVSCRPPKPPEPPPGVSCLEVCANLTRHDCPAAKPTAKGASCKTVCEDFQASTVARWNLDCMASAPSCEAIDACNP